MITPEKQQEINRLLDATAHRFAESGCKTCVGKGYYLHNPIGTVKKVPRVGRKKGAAAAYRSVCTCARDGYRRRVKVLLAMPCQHCTAVGEYCEHRPRDLLQYMEICRERWAGPQKS